MLAGGPAAAEIELAEGVEIIWQVSKILGTCDMVATTSKEERPKTVDPNKDGQKNCLSNKIY